MASKNKEPKTVKGSVKKPTAKSAPARPKSKPRRKPHDTVTPQTKISIERKRERILELTEAGASIRQIADRLTAEGWDGCGRSNVGKMLKEALDEVIAENKLKAKQYVALELNKERKKELGLTTNFFRLVDADSTNIKEHKESKHADDIEKYSRSLERVTRRVDALLGTHKPVKFDRNAREALAKLLGRSPEELPSGDSES